MAFLKGSREQVSFLPACIDEYVKSDDAVRAYDAFVEQLDFAELGINVETNQAGPPAFDPRAMVKLLVYGYSYGYRSSRKLERATHHNLSVIWLMGGLQPDHKTIARFRKENKVGLSRILKQCARLCLKLGLIEGNTLFVDGTKMRANASLMRQLTRKRCRKMLKRLDERIDEILAETEAADEAEQGQPSMAQLRGELKRNEDLRDKVREALKELEEDKKASANTTDPECAMMKSRQGTHPGYNVQAVVDEKNSLIVQADVVAENNDRGQFGKQVSQANEVLGRDCKTACADAGYANTKELKAVVDKGIEVVVPSEEQLQEHGPYSRTRFSYDKERDVYVCPKGQELSRRSADPKNGVMRYRYLARSAAACRRCSAFGQCTTSQQGRMLLRLHDEEVKQKIEKHFEEPASQATFSKRKSRCEHPFGHLKWNRGIGSFLLRGLSGAKAEAGLMFVGFNLMRMISILGAAELLKKLAET